ncbi:Uncharacterized protein APZ42_028009 [Daphnia magna]|uniref:Uncharacterized protein n=1 Tax=Daphnia magna TaxID=35525 RepID=A0A164QWG4_9CRUS|nr:Uncharacterized protein APZ42_028009 [Daphnia magna]
MKMFNPTKIEDISCNFLLLLLSPPPPQKKRKEKGKLNFCDAETKEESAVARDGKTGWITCLFINVFIIIALTKQEKQSNSFFFSFFLSLQFFVCFCFVCFLLLFPFG